MGHDRGVAPRPSRDAEMKSANKETPENSIIKTNEYLLPDIPNLFQKKRWYH